MFIGWTEVAVQGSMEYQRKYQCVYWMIFFHAQRARLERRRLTKLYVTKFKVTSKMHESVKHKEKCFLANSRMLIEVVLVISQVVIPVTDLIIMSGNDLRLQLRILQVCSFRNLKSYLQFIAGFVQTKWQMMIKSTTEQMH